MNMKRKPIIGISGGVRFDKGNDPFPGYPRSYVNEDYVKGVEANGGLPFIIPVTNDLEIAKAQVAAVDAIVLSGGDDVDPANYNEEPLAKIGSTYYERDLFDYTLLEEALRQDKPVLAICRGLQIVNTYFNGTLYQDLSYANLGDKLIKHMAPNNISDFSHHISINDKTELYKLIPQKKVRVNSLHHQAVKKVGEGLTVAATSEDGIVEALVSEKYPKLIAVQWHPEKIFNSSKHANILFENLIKQA